MAMAATAGSGWPRPWRARRQTSFRTPASRRFHARAAWRPIGISALVMDSLPHLVLYVTSGFGIIPCRVCRQARKPARGVAAQRLMPHPEAELVAALGQADPRLTLLHGCERWLAHDTRSRRPPPWESAVVIHTAGVGIGANCLLEVIACCVPGASQPLCRY